MAQRAGATSPEVPPGDTFVMPLIIAPLPRARSRRPAWCPEDIVDEWGAQSFPASDPPSNW